MREPQVLVIRIYRRDPNLPDRIDGLIEVVATKREYSFASGPELVKTIEQVIEGLGEGGSRRR